MDIGEYCQAVRGVLGEYRTSVVFKVANVIKLMPANTRSLVLEIFVDQDGEGFLKIMASLDGPDLYVLNKQIAPDAELFTTRMTEAGFVPPLPLMGRNESFDVNDALTDCAAEWLQSLCSELQLEAVTVPVIIESHDQYGSLCPIYINRN